MDFLSHQEYLPNTLVEECEVYPGRLAKIPLEQDLELEKCLILLLKIEELVKFYDKIL